MSLGRADRPLAAASAFGRPPTAVALEPRRQGARTDPPRPDSGVALQGRQPGLRMSLPAPAASPASPGQQQGRAWPEAACSRRSLLALGAGCVAGWTLPSGAQPAVCTLQSRAPLYPRGGAPRYGDICQGELGDCYLLAVLAAVAYRDPLWLRASIRGAPARPDGVRAFAVRLFHRAPGHGHLQADWYEVHDTIWCHGVRSALWVALFEQAFGCFCERFDLLPLPAEAQDGLRIAHGGFDEAFAAITGEDSGYFTVHPAYQPEIVTSLGRINTNSEYLLGSLCLPGVVAYVSLGARAQILPGSSTELQLEDGALVCDYWPGGTLLLSQPDGQAIVLYPAHAYAVLTVNSAGDLLLYNPHGHNLVGQTRRADLRRLRGDFGPGAFWLRQAYVVALVHRLVLGRMPARRWM